MSRGNAENNILNLLNISNLSLYRLLKLKYFLGSRKLQSIKINMG